MRRAREVTGSKRRAVCCNVRDEYVTLVRACGRGVRRRRRTRAKIHIHDPIPRASRRRATTTSDTARVQVKISPPRRRARPVREASAARGTPVSTLEMSGWDQRACAAQTSGVATPRARRSGPAFALAPRRPTQRPVGRPLAVPGRGRPGSRAPRDGHRGRHLRRDSSLGHGDARAELTDRHLEVLAAVFRENHLANALELVQTGRVKRLVAERSGRSCFQVQGKSAREEYLVHPRHYCSCRAFQWDVVSRGDQLICKHQLAARIAQATGAYPVASVTDLLMAQLLEAYMRGGDTRGGGDRRWGGGGGGGGGWGGGGGRR